MIRVGFWRLVRIAALAVVMTGFTPDVSAAASQQVSVVISATIQPAIVVSANPLLASCTLTPPPDHGLIRYCAAASPLTILVSSNDAWTGQLSSLSMSTGELHFAFEEPVTNTVDVTANSLTQFESSWVGEQTSGVSTFAVSILAEINSAPPTQLAGVVTFTATQTAGGLSYQITIPIVLNVME